MRNSVRACQVDERTASKLGWVALLMIIRRAESQKFPS